VVSGVLEGLRFVWGNRVLRTLGLIELAVTGLYLPMESVLFPKYFSDRNEPAHLGWVLMALSIGGLIGATILTLVALPAFYLLLFGREDTAKGTAHD
jgi:hypothetical protein